MESGNLIEKILNKVDDYNIFRYYLGQDFDFKKKFLSPFRKDRTPNLCFYLSRDGKRVLFKDFANGKGGDCFKFVQELFGLTLGEALKKIDQDFGLGIISNNNPVFKIQLVKKPDNVKITKILQVQVRPFTQRDLDYWSDYHITKDELVRKKIFSVDKLYINKRLIPSHGDELRFAYLFDDNIKIYSPYGKIKWLSSCPNEFISGFDDIKYKVFSGTQDEKLFISKSLKDEIVLSKFFKDVCSTQNESSAAISSENMQIILKGYKRENVYIMYDNDKAGHVAADYYTNNYGFQSIFTPDDFKKENIKDWADLVLHKDLDTMENYLKIKNLI